MGTCCILELPRPAVNDDWFRFSLFRRLTIWVGGGWLPVGINLRGFGFEFQAAVGWRDNKIGWLGYFVRLLGWDVVISWERWVKINSKGGSSE